MQKDLGAILLIAGTTIGAGMLALPVITSPLGLVYAILSYFSIFIIMLMSARFFVKLALHYNEPHNFVDLAKKTLGLKGQGACWIIYLLLMYALVAAYMSASASMVSSLLKIPLTIFSETSLVLFLPAVFALFLTFGLKGIDHLNRLLMAGLIFSFVILCLFLAKKLNTPTDVCVDLSYFTKALPIIITSFGYHIIIPTVAEYLDRDKKRIMKALIIGSIIPLIIYILWHLLVYYNLSQTQLFESLKTDMPISEILSSIHPSIKKAAFFFAFFAIVTSFLGVAISLFDFLRDSLPKKIMFKNKKILFTLTFLPPLVYIFYFKKAFYMALDHAGILVSLLLIILPALMYIKINKKNKFSAFVLIAFGLFVIITDVIQKTCHIN